MKDEKNITIQNTTYTCTVTLSFQIKPDEYLIVDLQNLARELPLARTVEQSRELNEKKANSEMEASKQTIERLRPYKKLSTDNDYKGKVNLMARNYVQIVRGTTFNQDNVPPYVKELADRKSHWIKTNIETHTGIAK